MDGLEAGTEEGVRIEVEKIKEDEAPETEERMGRETNEADRLSVENDERKE